MAIAPQLTAAYGARVVAVRQAVRRVVGVHWDALGANRRDANAAAFAAAVTPVVQAGQRVNVAATRAYFAQLVQDAYGQPMSDEELQAAIDEAGAGDPMVSDFTQPFNSLWAALAAGAAFDVAEAIARNQADALVGTNLSYASLGAMSGMMRAKGLMLYNREVVSSNPCATCIDAADGGPYKGPDLAPIHNSCSCIAVPVFVEFGS